VGGLNYEDGKRTEIMVYQETEFPVQLRLGDVRMDWKSVDGWSSLSASWCCRQLDDSGRILMECEQLFQDKGEDERWRSAGRKCFKYLDGLRILRV
jgi:hypothetical protein